MRHIEPSRLFAVAEGRDELQTVEREHLKNCEDCQQVLAVFKTYVTDTKKKGDDE